MSTGRTGLPACDDPSANAPDTAGQLFVDDGDGIFPLAAGDGGGSISVSAAKPVASIAQLADYLVNGFWAYNSALSHHWFSSTITYNITGLNADEQFLARSALAAWHDVANVNFVETSGSANITFTHNGTMQAVTSASWYGSGAMASATVNISTDWVTTDGGARDGKTGIDSYAYQTYIHEIGHALGLGHQGPYNGSASYSTNALFANDTWQYSIMSYFSEPNYSGSSYRYVVTPQMADIYAVAAMYGAATTTRTGDTVYGFNSNAGAVFGFANYTSAPAFTIYDNGGSDTLDCSLYSSTQRIDLHASAFSSVGGLVNNIGIALNAAIEKAIGGSGNDMLIASDLGCTLIAGAGADTLTGGAGIDRLVGGSGIDTMTGGGGADSFVFAFGDSSASSNQHDRITDFVAGTDRIDISAIDAIAGTGALDLFRFLGSAAFDGAAGALNYVYNSALGVTTLQGDTNGDRVADFAIDLVGNITIALRDLVGATPAVNHAPVVTLPSANMAASAGQAIAASSLFGATDSDGDSLTYYIYDANPSASSGHFAYNGVAIPSQTVVALSAADLAHTTFVAGAAGTSDELRVIAFDGQTYSNDSIFTYLNVNVAGPNHAPVITLPTATVTASAGQTIAASSLFGATDSDGDSLTYYIYDANSSASSGHFAYNGVAMPSQAVIGLSAAQLANTTFVAGAAGTSDELRVIAFDGQTYSNDSIFTYLNVNVAGTSTNHAPVITLASANVATTAGQTILVSNLFSATDADGDSLSYYIYDANSSANSGYFAYNGVAMPSQTVIGLTAAQLANTTFVAGAAGTSDELRVIAFDGQTYSNNSIFTYLNVSSSARSHSIPAPAMPGEAGPDYLAEHAAHAAAGHFIV
ncbi:M10 family metallopeptidase [Bradyrhizobium lablabi]|uniref:M10 family metallopeptidase n=1 Tax=Bradyrhizobium lablabi TaxID=722472 RepID=UPI001BAAB912|nr:M10 family metallopeptidase [Bradyrhizobium lablabi]MBR1120229.1 M10 family metallopeptidase [Bradyrhizobium lablabi]